MQLLVFMMAQPTRPLRLVLVSDTHGQHHGFDVPEGDILLHAGDLTSRGTPRQLGEAARWLGSLPHPHKIVIAGNHDFCLESHPLESRRILEEEGGVTYLCDQEIMVAGIRIWGSPWQPWFYDWAFNLHRGLAIAEKWALIPWGIDVLVTHGPPAGILDRNCAREAVGCVDLAAATSRVRPRLHVFGHIHEAHGRLTWEGTLYVNACICDLGYRPIQPPEEVTWPPRGTSR